MIVKYRNIGLGKEDSVIYNVFKVNWNYSHTSMGPFG